MPASSCRRPASSPVPAARRSTSCAPGLAWGQTLLGGPTPLKPTSPPVPRSFVAEARKRVGPKKLRIRPIIERLAVEHEDATIALTFRSALELLVSVMLSAQTTDVNVNRVTATLFEKYRRPEDYLAVEQEELERDIFATGFYRQKARSLRGTMRILLDEFEPTIWRPPGRA